MEGNVHVCLVGAMGKMCRVISEYLFNGDGHVSVAMAVDPCVSGDFPDDPINSICKKDILQVEFPELFDVVVDFSEPESTEKLVWWCQRMRKPLITGTTGLNEAQLQVLKACAQQIPILHDSNMSLGVNLIDTLLPQMVKILQGFEIEMVEIHNANKKDAPSGTAIRFAQTLVKAKGGEIIFGRAKGKSDNRPITDVVVHAIRGGDSAGGAHNLLHRS